MKSARVGKVRKGAPIEVSSRQATAPPRAKRCRISRPRDPRFDDLSGKLDVDLFQKSYAFLEEYRDEELEGMKKEASTLRKRLRRRKSAAGFEREADLGEEMRRITQQDKQRQHLGEMRAAERALRREEREKVRTTGKTPYFHTQADIRARVVEGKRKENKRALRDRQAERRERKLAGRGKRRLPTRREEKAEDGV